MTPHFDVEAAQRALDALITGDRDAAADHFADGLVMTGIGGCLGGRSTGLPAVLDRFADIARLTGGTFGTEVEFVYTGHITYTIRHVVIARHWASQAGSPIHGTQALVVSLIDGRVGEIDALSRPGSASGIWD